MTAVSLNQQLTDALFIGVVLLIPIYGVLKKRPVYEDFTHGAKDGVQILFEVLPHLVAMLVAIGMLRASGAIELFGQFLGPWLEQIGMPHEVLPLALVRPFSGSAANGVLASLAEEYGGDSYVAKVAATMMGSTETTFYVVALYFGVVHIRRTRHAIGVGLVADFVGVVAAVWICQRVFL